MALKLHLPKNKIIERALNRYLSMLEKEMYAQGFRKIAGDKEMLDLAEEGLEDYEIELNNWDAER